MGGTRPLALAIRLTSQGHPAGGNCPRRPSRVCPLQSGLESLRSPTRGPFPAAVSPSDFRRKVTTFFALVSLVPISAPRGPMCLMTEGMNQRSTELGRPPRRPLGCRVSAHVYDTAYDTPTYDTPLTTSPPRPPLTTPPLTTHHLQRPAYDTHDFMEDAASVGHCAQCCTHVHSFRLTAALGCRGQC